VWLWSLQIVLFDNNMTFQFYINALPQRDIRPTADRTAVFIEEENIQIV